MGTSLDFHSNVVSNTELETKNKAADDEMTKRDEKISELQVDSQTSVCRLLHLQRNSTVLTLRNGLQGAYKWT